MKGKTVKFLLEKLSPVASVALENAASFSKTRKHYEVTIEHFILKILEQDNTGFEQVLIHFKVDIDLLWSNMLGSLSKMRSNAIGKPSFSPLLMSLLEKSVSSSLLYYNHNNIISIGILDALVEVSAVYRTQEFSPLDSINIELLREHYKDFTIRNMVINEEMQSTSLESKEIIDEAGVTVTPSALNRFTENITQKALDGHIDPVLGRSDEVRLMIDILSRRRKNNPILVGEPGVGKTAIVEGLALKIANQNVPDELLNTSIYTLDLGLLQAGAGVKGEFEKRLKDVISEVKLSSIPIIIFIDEAHTLIGSGGDAGTNDAANILKPALARGELRTIAATTWSEYKKYFERDAALERRFQLVKINEPSIDNALQMLNGLKAIYEKYHGVIITDEAIEIAVNLSSRYINGRYLPDKAIDLLDTAAARVRVNDSNIPADIDSLDSQITYIVKRLDNLNKEIERGLDVDSSILSILNKELENLMICRDKLHRQWLKETALCQKIKLLQSKLEKSLNNNISSSDLNSYREKVLKMRMDLAAIQNSESTLSLEVNGNEISKVISDWTGIPIGKMMKDDLKIIMDLDTHLRKYIKGQNSALLSISKTLQNSKVGLNNQDAPLGVFLFTGPSGVGKTEVAHVLSDLLFGGERFLITLNMSEYQESHSISQLKGSPPGYVGYGEGGVLTEAVRQRPYSVVLLDEIEKAHHDIHNMFYQVFERGSMRDGEGREIDFKNTIIIMTSNIGSEIILDLPFKNHTDNHNENLAEKINQELTRYFPVALLARMQVVPFSGLTPDVILSITRSKFKDLALSVKAKHNMNIKYDSSLIESVAAMDKQLAIGARKINSIIENKITPVISKYILNCLLEESIPESIYLSITNSGDISLTRSIEHHTKNDALSEA